MTDVIAVWLITFIGAMAFGFSLQTTRTDCYVLYTITFAVCVAGLVAHFS